MSRERAEQSSDLLSRASARIAMRPTEKTRLTRPLDSPDYVEFASLLRTRRVRIRQFQCCVCATLITVFVMTVIVTVSYSVNSSDDDTDVKNESSGNLTASGLREKVPNLKMSLGEVDDTEGAVSNDSFGSFFVARRLLEPAEISNLSESEREACLKAGQTAMENRLRADAAVLLTPLPSPSPDSRQRLAVSTRPDVRPLALAAVAEIAATREIQSTRTQLGGPSPIGRFFDGGWAPKGSCKEFATSNCQVLGKYRSFDGSCNRPMQRGAAMTPFRRSLPADYADGIDAPRRAKSGKELPSAREISLQVHPPSASSNPSFTVMLAVFGQFLDHDITATAISQGIGGSSISCCPPSVGHPECFPVETPPGDPLRDIAGKSCIEFVRSAPAAQCKFGPRQQLNQVSAFIDASTIYGPDSKAALNLREGTAGRLRMQRTPDNRTLLPASTEPNDGCNREEQRLRGRYCFAAGDSRANENLHLTTMHLLWARRHNAIAEELARVNPTWDDETLYQEARRVVGAQLQHIAYQEFVPIVLGEKETTARDLRPLRDGYRLWNETAPDPSIANHFAAAAFRFAHSLLPGLMRVTDAQKGTSSYVELHRMLFNPYSLYANDGVENSVMSATSNFIQKTSTHVTSQLTRYLFEDPLKNVSVPCGLDLVSLNIQRGRDHGLPGYTAWREHCGLGKVESFEELQGHLDPQALREISIVYESVEDVDLYTGALAENPVPGGIVGPTFTCLIADQFVRLQRGDRYWYELADQPHSFTEDQLRELRKTSLASLICQCADGVEKIQPSVMRATGPENPIVSCEDIPRPSMKYWKVSLASTGNTNQDDPPLSWMDLQKDINQTVFNIKQLIDSMRTNESAASMDWLAFQNSIRDSFLDLKGQLAILHPKKKTNTSGSATANALHSTKFNDWITFKDDLIKGLNDSVRNISGGPPNAAQWFAFKNRVKDQFADLKSQIASITDALKAKTKSKSLAQGEASDNDTLLRVPLIKTIPSTYDWMNSKDTIVRSLDAGIANILNDFPNGSAWATYRDELKNKYSTVQTNINGYKQYGIVEREINGKNSTMDWLNFADTIVQSINKTVEKIKNEMPLPGDPAWPLYQERIKSNFMEFRKKVFPWKVFVNVTSTAAENDREAEVMTQLANDWAEFREEINKSLSRVIQETKDHLSTVLDPMGWLAFRNTVKSEFANIKNDIEHIKSEWIEETNKTNNTEKKSKIAESDDILRSNGFSDSGIVPIDWENFKIEINNTIANFVKTINDTNKVNWTDLDASIISYFFDLKKDIASLKHVISNTDNTPKDTKTQLLKSPKYKVESSKCYAKLNTTMNNLVDNLQKQDKKSTVQLIDLLFQARANFSDLESTNSPCAQLNENITKAKKLNYVKSLKPLRSTSYSVKVEAYPSLTFFLFVYHFRYSFI